VQWVFALCNVIDSLEEGERKDEGYLLTGSEVLQQAMDISNVMQKYFIVSKSEIVWKLSTDLSKVLVEESRQIDAIEAYAALSQLEFKARQANCDSKEDLLSLSQTLETLESCINLSESLISSDYASIGRTMNCGSILVSVFSNQRQLPKFKLSLLEALVKSAEKSFKLLNSDGVLTQSSSTLVNYRAPAKELVLVYGFRAASRMSESLDRCEFLSAKQNSRFRKMLDALQGYADELIEEMLEFWSTTSNQESRAWSAEPRFLQTLLIKVYAS